MAGNDTDRVVTLTFNGEDFTPARFGVVVVSRKRKRGDSDAGGGDGGGGGAPGPSFDSQRASDGLQAAEYFCLPDYLGNARVRFRFTAPTGIPVGAVNLRSHNSRAGWGLALFYFGTNEGRPP